MWLGQQSSKVVADTHFENDLNEEVFRGPVSHFPEFRNHLLTIHDHGFDWNRFIGPTHFNSEMEQLKYLRGCISGAIASWTLSSRRVYTIDEELQLLLSITSLEGVDWRMVHFPFDSFLLKLAFPIRADDGRSFDSILVSKVADLSPAKYENGYVRPVSLILIPEELYDLDKVVPMSQRQKLTRWMKNDLQKAAAFLQGIRGLKKPNVVIINVRPDILETNLVAEASKDSSSYTEEMFRLLFGTLLYMQSLPAIETGANTWTKEEGPKKSIVRPSIDDESLVCHIVNHRKLIPEEKKVFKEVALRKTGYEMSAHHREGHWRRPPGHGDDPNYPKTVWVRPTIVRKDRLSKDGLPGGLEKEL